jgi:CHAT domain-containing protein
MTSFFINKLRISRLKLSIILAIGLSPFVFFPSITAAQAKEILHTSQGQFRLAQKTGKKIDYDSEINRYQRTLESYQNTKAKNSLEIGSTLWILGNLHVQKGIESGQAADYSKALDYLENSLAIGRENRDSWLELKSLISLILIDHNFLAERGKFQGYIEQTLAAIQKSGIRTDTNGFDPSISLMPFSPEQLKAMLGQDPKGSRFPTDSINVQQTIKSQKGLGASAFFGTFIPVRTTLYDKALSSYQFKDLNALYAIEETMLGQALFSNISEQENQTYFDNFQYSTSALISYDNQVNPKAKDATQLALNAILSRKGRILDIYKRASLALPTASERSKAQQDAVMKAWSVLNWRYSQEWVYEGKFKDSEQEERNRNIAFFTQVGMRLGAFSDETTENPSVQAKEGIISWQLSQRALPSDMALIEFARYRPYNPRAAIDNRWGQPRYAAYLLLSTGEPQGFDLGTTEEIDNLVVQLRRLLGDKGSDLRQLNTVAQQLEAKLTRPIRAGLGNTRKLLISPDAQLNLLPFDALVDENNRYLAENYSINYLTSGRDLFQLQQLQTAQPRQNTLIVADPDFTNGSSSGAGSSSRSADLKFLNCCGPVNGAAKEAEVLQKLMPQAKVMTQRNATKEVIQQAKAPKILHIATHGFFLSDRIPPLYAQAALKVNPTAYENPLLRSGLALAGFDPKSGNFGGALTALEASQLDLRGTELVVLSACQTGVGEIKNGEGVYGLRRAFMLAGAKSLLLSLWDVDDGATYSLMSSYYSRLSQGEGRSQALINTQRTMLKSQSFSHPHYWAGFFHSGDWSPIGNRGL